MIFYQILKLPDPLLYFPFKYIENEDGKKINVVYATTEKGNVTNKFKLFLKLLFYLKFI